ncbi:MAG: excisionase family DNA-binding protein [Desulfobacterales bacterium]|jgi:excisionase family DNA binding protein
METPPKTLSVARAAALCGVNRNTVGLWIRSGKLRANRVGRNYAIPVEELIFLLKSTRQNIPEELKSRETTGPIFRSIPNCWQYFEDKVFPKECENCTVFKKQLNVCFIGKESSALHCNGQCVRCEYYHEVYRPRIEFIHQIDFPAAIYKDLYFWAGNKRWAEICEVKVEDLTGMGIEKVYHPDSLETIISNNKKRELGDPLAPRIDRIFLKSSKFGRREVMISVYPLLEPSGSWLLLAESEQKK